MIKLLINGKEETLDEPTSLVEYLDSLNVNRRFIAVANNGIVVRRSELDTVTLKDGDRLEIVRAVGGG